METRSMLEAAAREAVRTGNLLELKAIMSAAGGGDPQPAFQAHLLALAALRQALERIALQQEGTE